jgi:hypothetical protein
MSNSKLDKTESASSLARLVAGLGAVLGVTSITVHAASPPEGAAPIQETLPSATARQGKMAPVNTVVTQGKIAPSGGVVMHRSLPQQPLPAASAVQGKIAPPVSAVARQDKFLPVTAPIKTRSIPAVTQKSPTATASQGKTPPADHPVK